MARLRLTSGEPPHTGARSAGSTDRIESLRVSRGRERATAELAQLGSSGTIHSAVVGREAPAIQIREVKPGHDFLAIRRSRYVH